MTCRRGDHIRMPHLLGLYETDATLLQLLLPPLSLCPVDALPCLRRFAFKLIQRFQTQKRQGHLLSLASRQLQFTLGLFAFRVRPQRRRCLLRLSARALKERILYFA